MSLADQRYTVTSEWCGYPEQRYVARFCGDWLGQDKTKTGATMICLSHADARDRANTESQL